MLEDAEKAIITILYGRLIDTAMTVKEAEAGLDRVIPKTQIGNEPSVGFFVSL